LLTHLKKILSSGQSELKMTENLKKLPGRGILKASTSFEQRELDAHHTPRNPHFDEQNLLETLHPADKDYGFMKIDEPKTPFEYASGIEEEGDEDTVVKSDKEKRDELDARELSERIQAEAGKLPRRFSDPSEDGGEDDLTRLSPEDRARRQSFEQKRKSHYNEFYAVKMARQLMAESQEEEEEENDGEVETEAHPKGEEGASTNMDVSPK